MKQVVNKERVSTQKKTNEGDLVLESTIEHIYLRVSYLSFFLFFFFGVVKEEWYVSLLLFGSFEFEVFPRRSSLRYQNREKQVRKSKRISSVNTERELKKKVKK